MREQRQKQVNLAPEWLAFDHSQELQVISGLLDSNLLWESVRVLTRLMTETQEMLGADVRFGNRTRRAKRRALGILNARNKEQREPLYRDLLKVAKETIDAADDVTKVIDRATLD